MACRVCTTTPPSVRYYRVVINALSDKYHPLQTLADIMTLSEHFGSHLSGKTLTWVGDGNNIIHDLMIGAIKMGMNVKLATPEGYSPDAEIYKEAQQLAIQNNVNLCSTNDPQEAVRGADVVVTDTWVSMGQEEEAARRKRDFAGYQVNAQMMGAANPDAVFLHCLPRKPEEVTDEVSKWEKCNTRWLIASIYFLHSKFALPYVGDESYLFKFRYL